MYGLVARPPPGPLVGPRPLTARATRGGPGALWSDGAGRSRPCPVRDAGALKSALGPRSRFGLADGHPPHPPRGDTPAAGWARPSNADRKSKWGERTRPPEDRARAVVAGIAALKPGRAVRVGPHSPEPPGRFGKSNHQSCGSDLLSHGAGHKKSRARAAVDPLVGAPQPQAGRLATRTPDGAAFARGPNNAVNPPTSNRRQATLGGVDRQDARVA